MPGSWSETISCRPLVNLLAAAWLLFVAGHASADGSGGTNAPEHFGKPHLVLVSVDGLGAEALRRLDTPALDSLAAGGVSAEALIPVYPTLTFPNHYSIATGLYPAEHGIVGNRFLDASRKRLYALDDREAVEDGSWYGGEPIWVAAERRGMVSAAYFFVGTEADIGSIRPTYWYRFNPTIAGARRVDQVLEWLSLPDAERPHVITLYFEHVDRATHEFGPRSPEEAAAVAMVDEWIGRLRAGIAELPVADRTAVIVVSDHGQATYRQSAPTLVIDEVVNLEGITAYDHGSVAFLYFDAPDPLRAEAICDAINEVWLYGQAVTPAWAPESWHLDAGPRMPDVIVQPDPRYAVRSSRSRDVRLTPGDHGWSPDFEGMHGIFLAAGPGLPRGEEIGAIRAVDVYPLMLELLGLPQARGPDGRALRNRVPFSAR